MLMGVQTMTSRSKGKRKNLEDLTRRMKKAERLLKEGGVIPVYHSTSDDFYEFRVIGDHEVHTVIKRGKLWACDCKFNSLYPDKPCSHILACMLYLDRNAD